MNVRHLRPTIVRTGLAVMLMAAGLFAAAPAYAACINPTGTEGDILYNSTRHVIQGCANGQWTAFHAGPYTPQAVRFDGVDDNLQRGVIAADSKMATVSFWVKRNGGIGAQQRILRSTGNDFTVFFTATNIIRVNGRDGSGNNDLSFDSTLAITDSNWHHVLISFDTNTASARIYIDDVDVTAGGATVVNDTINFDSGDNRVGTDGAAQYLNASLADLWFDVGTYMDLSVTANRRKFRDAAGNAVSLGATGNTPTGTAPEVFLTGAAASWHTNRGTGGAYTVNGGGLSAASFGAVYTPSAVDFNGSTWLKRGGALTGVADGKQFTASFWMRSTDGSVWKRILSAPTERFLLHAEAAGTSTCLFLRTQTAAGAAAIDLRFACGMHDGQWRHIMMSFDVNAGLSNVYVNGVSDGNIYNLNNVVMDFTHANWGIGVEPTNNWNPWVNGQIADLWLDFGTYIDLSMQSNREKFYKNGPVDLGATGNLPTGTAPDIFLSGDLAAWHTNKGTGGGFTMTGALTSSSFGYTSPYVCSSPDGASGDMVYNTAARVLQGCTQSGWKALHRKGSGSAGCSSPAGANGDIFYNTSAGVFQACSADGWQAMNNDRYRSCVTNGLAAYWRLDEGSGSAAADSMAGSPGTLVSSPVWVSDGRIGSAIYLDGAGAQALSANSATINALGAAMSIAFWIRDDGTSTAWATLASKTNWSNSGWSIQRRASTPAIYLRTDTSGGTNQASSPDIAGVLDGSWHHIVFTIQNNTGYAYKDGAYIGNMAFTLGGGIANAQNMLFGNNLRGRIDDVRIYNRVLTAPEITTLANLCQ